MPLKYSYGMGEKPVLNDSETRHDFEMNDDFFFGPIPDDTEYTGQFRAKLSSSVDAFAIYDWITKHAEGNWYWHEHILQTKHGECVVTEIYFEDESDIYAFGDAYIGQFSYADRTDENDLAHYFRSMSGNEDLVAAHRANPNLQREAEGRRKIQAFRGRLHGQRGTHTLKPFLTVR